MIMTKQKYWIDSETGEENYSHACENCGETPNTGCYINDYFYCLDCARAYILDNMPDLENTFAVDTFDEVVCIVMNMTIDDICSLFGFMAWEY